VTHESSDQLVIFVTATLGCYLPQRVLCRYRCADMAPGHRSPTSRRAALSDTSDLLHAGTAFSSHSSALLGSSPCRRSMPYSFVRPSVQSVPFGKNKLDCGCRYESVCIPVPFRPLSSHVKYLVSLLQFYKTGDRGTKSLCLGRLHSKRVHQPSQSLAIFH
jgi:hypothetical protein